MSIGSEIHQLTHDALIELFVLDATAQGAPSVYRFHNGTNKLSQPVVWQGLTYSPFAIQADGFDKSATGPLARPRLRVANNDLLLGGSIGTLVRQYKNLAGAKITRKRTLAKYLDAVNFPGGVNPTADSNASFADEVWYIDRKIGHNKLAIEFELASVLDLEGRMIGRVMTEICSWKYRGEGCGYTGGAKAKADDTPTTVLAEDQCSKRLTGCRMRFPPPSIPLNWNGVIIANIGTTPELPFGGFPQLGKTRL